MKIVERLTRIDRRIIYLVLAIVVVLPLIFRSPGKVRVMQPVERLYDAVDAIPKDKVLIIDFEYAPQDMPELEPMGFALLRHAFEKRIKVLALCLYVQPLGLAQKALTQVTEEFNSVAQSNADSIIYGRDYVFLGWQPPPLIPMLGMGTSITNVYKVDYYGNQTDTLPLMKNARNYNDVALLVSLCASSIPRSWIAYAQNRFGVAVAAGVTAVSAAYEELVETRLNIKESRKASEALPSLTYGHLVMIAFIIVGNIGYFMQKRRQK
jgi:hypothetical protein